MASPRISRRRFLGASAGALAAATLPSVVRAQGKKELVFVGFGGSYQEGQTKALFDPFEKETGIKVVQTTGGHRQAPRAGAVEERRVGPDLDPGPAALHGG